MVNRRVDQRVAWRVGWKVEKMAAWWVEKLDQRKVEK